MIFLHLFIYWQEATYPGTSSQGLGLTPLFFWVWLSLHDGLMSTIINVNKQKTVPGFGFVFPPVKSVAAAAAA